MIAIPAAAQRAERDNWRYIYNSTIYTTTDIDTHENKEEFKPHAGLEVRTAEMKRYLGPHRMHATLPLRPIATHV